MVAVDPLIERFVLEAEIDATLRMVRDESAGTDSG